MRYLITFVFLFISYFSFGQIVGTQVLAFKGNVTSTIRDGLDVPTGEYWMIYNTTTAQLEVSDDTDTWSAFSAGTDDQTASEVPITDAGGLITATDVEGALQENRTAIDLNTAKVTNATHTGDVTGATALTIATGAVAADELASTTVTPGSYTNTDLTVDADGRITAASNGSAGGGLASTDIDTYSELNTIVADVTLTHNGLFDTFSELDAIVADKSLVNLEDVNVFTSAGNFFEQNIKIDGAAALDSGAILFYNNGGTVIKGAFGYDSGNGVNFLNSTSGAQIFLPDGGGANFNDDFNLLSNNIINVGLLEIEGTLTADAAFGADVGSVTLPFAATHSREFIAQKSASFRDWRINGNTSDDDLDIDIETTAGSATWTAAYKFNATGVPVDPTDVTDKAYVDGVVTGGGAGDHSLSVEDQSIPASTLRVVDTDASGSAISFENSTVEVMRIGNNNDNAVYVRALEAIPSGPVTIGLTSPLNFPDFDTSVSSATTYAGALVIDGGELFWANGGAWNTIGGVPGTISGRTGTTVSGVMIQTAAQLASDGAPAADEVVFCSDCKDYSYPQIALSNLTTTLTTGTKKGMWIAPAAGTIESPTNDGIMVTLDVPGTATGINIDINKNGSDIATTNLTTDATEASSDTATTDFALSSYTFVRGDKFTFDMDAVPTGATGALLTLKVIYD